MEPQIAMVANKFSLGASAAMPIDDGVCLIDLCTILTSKLGFKDI